MAHSPPEKSAHEAHGDLGLERIAYFSDAVIAIAITLLVLDIRLPELQGDPEVELPRVLLGLWPRYATYLLSFLVIGSYWWGHHRMFRVVRRYDETLIWLNISFLACIAFVPFASAVLGEHGDQTSAAVFYAVVIAATGMAEAALWAYASHHRRLVDPALSAQAVRLALLRMLIAPAVFLLTLPLALLSPFAAKVSWFLIYPVVAILLRVERRQSMTTPTRPVIPTSAGGDTQG